MPLWDYKCSVEDCEHVVLDVFMVPGRMVPEHCGEPMTRRLAAPSFVVSGFSAKNGYSGGQTYEITNRKNPLIPKNTRVQVKS